MIIVFPARVLVEYDNKSVYDICLSIGVDLKDENFQQKLFEAIDEYIDSKHNYTAGLQI